MDDKMLNSFAMSLLSDSSDKLKEIINTRINEIEQGLKEQISKVESKAESRLVQLENYVSEQPLSINFGTIEKPKNRIVHRAFDTVIKILQSNKRINKNIMLVGPAGSGKSSLCQDVADSLKLQFYPMSVGLQTTKSDLLGFINAHGEYVTTPLRQAFENGGVLLLDEFDATHAGVVTILNSLLANGICSFPDKIVEKHKDFICIVACNTYGKGGSVEYVGRNRLDSATLDRFTCVKVDYDDTLENKLTKNKEWLKIIRKIRANIKQHGINLIVSPRASMQGADLLDSGFSVEDVLEMVVLKGVNKDIKANLLKDINFSKINKQSQDEDKNNQKELKPNKPISVEINVDKSWYKVSNIVENIAISSIIDWNGKFNVWISSQSDWQAGISAEDLFLNAGFHESSFNKENIKNLISELDTYSSDIKLDNQDIDLYIILDEEKHSYKIG